MIERQKKHTSLTDEQIVRRILLGENELQGEIYERYAVKVYRKCIGVFKEKDLAKDISHDIFIKIFTSLSQFKGTSAFSFWVYSITYNHCMTQVKNRNKVRSQFKDLDDMKLEPMSMETIELENKVLKDMQLDELESAMERISGPEKVILLMRYQDKLSIDQIGVALNIGNSAVKMRLKRSRDNLAEQIKDKNDHG